MLQTIALAVITACLAAAAAAVHADGDPASDMLVSRNVYFPYNSPSRDVRTALQHAVDNVYAHGDRLRVALIYDPTDLGSVGSLFDHPDDYAKFLGIELGLWYVGPLLVAMPAGFGLYDGGRPTAAEDAILRSLHLDATSPDSLATSATAAVQHLVAADALNSSDVRSPLAAAHPAFAQRGKRATLRFDVFDDSGRSRAVVRVYEDRLLVATLASPMRFDIGTRKVGVKWQVPAKIASRQLRYCVVAFDPSGNRSQPACAPFLRVR